MAGNHKPRKAYRPRAVLTNATARRAIDGVIRRMRGARAGNVGAGVQVLGIDPAAPGGDKTVHWTRDEMGQVIISNPQEAASHG